MRGVGRVERLESTGVPVGMLPNASWREETSRSAHGDLLCVYSDGLTEAVDAAGRGVRARSSLGESSRGAALPVAELCDEVLPAVADFARGMPQYDDQTVLIAAAETCAVREAGASLLG